MNKTLNNMKAEDLAALWFKLDDARIAIEKLDRKFKADAKAGKLAGFAIKVPYRYISVWTDPASAELALGKKLYAKAPITMTQAKKLKNFKDYEHLLKEEPNYKFVKKEKK